MLEYPFVTVTSDGVVEAASMRPTIYRLACRLMALCQVGADVSCASLMYQPTRFIASHPGRGRCIAPTADVSTHAATRFIESNLTKHYERIHLTPTRSQN